VFGLALALDLQILADQWRLPEPKKYYSTNRDYYVEIIPTKLESQLKYFEDKSRKETPPGAKKGEKDNYCKGTLYKRTESGEYQKVWSVALSNEVAPVNALVSNDGQYLVTFDNWHLMGYGDNVVVIYGQDGKLIRKMSLEDIFSKAEIMRLPRSVSSIYWGGKHFIDEESSQLVLKVVARWSGSLNEEPELKDIRIDLRTGHIIQKEKIALSSRAQKITRKDNKP
jgi:hypothetical protein